MGPFGSNIKAENYRQSGVPVIRGTNLGERGEAPFIADGFVFLDDDKADSLASSSCSPGDLVFVAQGTVGKVGLVPSDSPYRRFVLSQNLMKVTLDLKQADPRFAFYFFRSSAGQHEIMSRVNPTGVPCISKPLTSLRKFGIRLPTDVGEQRAIGQMLGALDDKIELNRRLSQTLESMARALFKSWFVDFDPVRARANGAEPCLPSHLDHLFPDSFEDTSGGIPAGWRRGVVADIADVCSGSRPDARIRASSQEAKVPVWGGNGPMGYVDQALFDGPILLTGRVGTLGSVFRITSPSWPSDNTLILKPKDEIGFEYAYLLLRDLDLTSLNRGSTQPLLTQSDLRAQPALLPPRAILERFHDACRRLFERIDRSEAESLALGSLRNTQIPVLMSGGQPIDGSRSSSGEIL
jgi:type I restriction enzyme S subunit